MKLEVGMYCRYNGRISKISWISQQKFKGLYNTIEATFHLENDRIIKYPNDNFKASHNIIDLIEVGDYVNGYKIIGFDETYFNGTDRRKEPKKIEVIINNGKFEYENRIKKEDIKTILTKEQFENNCYKLGDK